jgi:hypothetical protein
LQRQIPNTLYGKKTKRSAQEQPPLTKVEEKAQIIDI